MKKVLFLACIWLIASASLTAQGSDQNDSFFVGANIGFPMSGTGDLASFNFGADIAYFFPVTADLEIGPLIAYSHFLGDGTYAYHGDDGIFIRDYKDASFVPIAVSGRYYFNHRQFYAGLDLGYAINVSGDAKNGFYGRPKFGYDFGAITIIGSFTGISGGTDYQGDLDYAVVTTSGFNTVNFGIEFGF